MRVPKDVKNWAGEVQERYPFLELDDWAPAKTLDLEIINDLIN